MSKASKMGWWNPRPHSGGRATFHYIGADGVSLCRRWMRLADIGTVEEGNDTHPENCKTCQKKKAAAK